MNMPSKFWSSVMSVFAVLTVFLIVISIKEIKSISYVGKNQMMVNSISVNGKGEAVTVPDIATFSFTVTETAKTVAEAQTKASTKNDDALKAIRAGGVVDKDIKTTSYNITPHYEYSTGVCTTYGCPPSKSTLTGYDVSQTTLVKVRDLSKAGALFGSIGSVGVDTVNGLTFTVDDIDTVRAKARAEAIANAQTKANELAKQLGVSLVRITSYYDSSDDYRPYAYGGDSISAKVLAAPAAAPEISTGEQKITSTVTITYEIK